MAKQKYKGKIPHLTTKTTNTHTNTQISWPESLNSAIFSLGEETFAISPLCNSGLSLHICKIRINSRILCHSTAKMLSFIWKKKSFDCL